MQRVLLSCRSKDDSRFLKSYLETELPYGIILAPDTAALEPALKGKSIHAIIMQSGNLAPRDLEYALKIRKSGYTHPIMIITDAIGSINVEEVHNKNKIYFMERPFELKTLKGLLRKIMVAKVVPQQVFRRYRTDMIAAIETFTAGDRYESHMFNLSRGGMYLELTKRPNVTAGDLLRLKVQGSDSEKPHHIHGRVVWTTHKGHAAGGYGLGIKFIKTTDIYRNLLDRV